MFIPTNFSLNTIFLFDVRVQVTDFDLNFFRMKK